MSRRESASHAKPPHVCAPVQPGTAARMGLLVSLSRRRRLSTQSVMYDTANCRLLPLPPETANIMSAQGICTHH